VLGAGCSVLGLGLVLGLGCRADFVRRLVRDLSAEALAEAEALAKAELAAP
jgi:hypothetical protein